MDPVDLPVVVADALAEARSASAGRSTRTLHGSPQHVMSQLVVALTAGHGLADHANPGEATVQVLSGTVRLTAGTASHPLHVDATATTGDYLVIPPTRHALDALTDAVVLLTIARKPRP